MGGRTTTTKKAEARSAAIDARPKRAAVARPKRTADGGRVPAELVTDLRGQAPPYFAKACALMALLTLFGCLAPQMPPLGVAVVAVTYAAISTIGALYFVVTRRMLRQYKLADGGSLAHINRRWPLVASALFVLSLASGFLFLLNAPKWDAAEWALTWLAVPLYFGVFAFLQWRLAKEFAPRFDKAHAMRWSFAVVGAVLCLAYAGVSMLSQAPDYPSLHAAYEGTYRPFADAPSAVMSEADKLASFADGLKDYALAKASGASVAVVFAVRVVVYASVFFGLMSQFGACLLDRSEVMGDFQLLPPAGKTRSAGPLLKRYFAVLGALAIAWSALFLWADAATAEAQTSEEHTAIERAVDELMANATIAIDGEAQEMLERKAAEAGYEQQIAALLAERRDELRPAAEAFYTKCRENVDAYLDWSGGAEAWMLRTVGFFNADPIRDKFFEIVENGADAGALEGRYAEYYDKIAQRAEEAQAETGGALDALLDQASPMQRDLSARELELWAPLEGDGAKAKNDELADVLLMRGGYGERDKAREWILGLIDEAEADTLAAIGASAS